MEGGRGCRKDCVTLAGQTKSSVEGTLCVMEGSRKPNPRGIQEVEAEGQDVEGSMEVAKRQHGACQEMRDVCKGSSESMDSPLCVRSAE